ncbi:MAG: Hsp33 family molecular chaperone HslO, partial [Sphingomonas sp.]
METPNADLDRALGFTIPARHARGRIVRLGPVLDEILAAHAYPPAIEALLAEALTLAALIGSTLKDAGGQLTLQAQTDGGVVKLLVCDYRGGELRGYVQFDEERLAEGPQDPTLFALFGQGYLAITFDQAATKERYQGVYCWYSGPSFETPAEIRMFQIIGGMAVGMSTVPETILARRFGMRVAGLSVITNLAAGI